MPAIVTAAELRTVLGVSSSLYSDAYLEGIIDSAEGVILPMLTAYQSAVSGVYLSNNVAYYLTQRPNQFVEGQSVVITGCVPSLFNGTVTVTSNAGNLYPPFSYSPLYVFSAAK
jgi:cytochrome c biogenesis protein CcdA